MRPRTTRSSAWSSLRRPCCPRRTWTASPTCSATGWVTSVLITGGDPMIMGAGVLRRYIEPLLEPGLEHLESIRLGSKSLAYWPQRFVTDPDADDTLRLFEPVVASGPTRAFMPHLSPPP